MIADLADLWRESASASRIALIVGAAAVLTHLASLLGAGWVQLSWLGTVLHLSVVLLIIGLVLAQLSDRVRGLWRANTWRGHEPMPRRLVWLCIALAVYALLWFAGTFAYYGEGETGVRNGIHVWLRRGAIVRQFTPAQAQWFDARAMSVFSAAWVAAALPLAIAYQRRKARREIQ